MRSDGVFGRAARGPRGLSVTAGCAAVVAVVGVTAAPAARPAAITNIVAEPQSVTSISSSDAWAGQGFTPGLLHWDGTQWANASLACPGTACNILDVSAASPSQPSSPDVWAVGSYGQGSSVDTLTEHWNGTIWTQLPSPNPGGTSMYGSDLDSVSAVSASDAWAVGYYSTPTAEFQTLILHWNGTAWTQVASPDPGNNPTLYSVTSISATDAWAVGSYTSTTAIKNLILHWDGNRWTQVKAPSPGAVGNGLASVSAVSASDVWAAGGYSTSSGGKTLLLHWDGTSWTQVPTPDPGVSTGVDSVSAVSSSLAFAVGSYTNRGAGPARTLLLQWNGTSWTQVPTPNPSPSTNNVLSAVAASSPSDAWAVGSYTTCNPKYCGDPEQRAIMLHWNGTSWSRS